MRPAPRRRFGAALVSAALLVTAACTLGPEYARPDPPAAADRFAADTREAAGTVLAEGWWKRYDDVTLNALVEETLRRNLDLRKAAARVLESRALLVQRSSDKYPSLDAAASAERSKAVSSFFGGATSNQFTIDLGLSWEVDLWGRVRRTEEAALERLFAAEEDRLALYHSLVAEAVRSYLDMIALDRQVRLAERTVETDRRNLDLVDLRYRRGLVPARDVYQARQTLATSEARVPLFRQGLELARHRLNVLRAEYPAKSLALPTYDELPVPEAIPVGLPSELLERRPDIRAAEHRLVAANAEIGAAKAGLFPRVGLTIAGGHRSAELADLVDSVNHFWTLLANVAQPLFKGGALRAAVRQAEARTESAAADYASAVLRAFREVEDALVSEQEQAARREALRRATADAGESYRTSRDRYLRGLDDLLPSLSARRSLYLAEADLIETERQLLRNRVNLHLALGGDWGDGQTVTSDR